MKPRRDRIDTFAMALGAVALAVVVVAIVWTINLELAPKPPPPTLRPPPTLSATDLAATQAAAATASAKQRALAVTLAAVMQVTPGGVNLGIGPASAAPSGAADFVADNVWVGLFDQTWISAYAGALRSDPEQGAVLLVTVAPDRVDQQQFTAPLSHGTLRITSQNVQRLVLAAPDGTKYYFDLLARGFVGSLTAYADTATPLPSLTPSASPTASATLTPTTPLPTVVGK